MLLPGKGHVENSDSCLKVTIAPCRKQLPELEKLVSKCHFFWHFLQLSVYFPELWMEVHIWQEFGFRELSGHFFDSIILVSVKSTDFKEKFSCVSTWLHLALGVQKWIQTWNQTDFEKWENEWTRKETLFSKILQTHFLVENRHFSG